jgi:hypothetical protein
MPSYVDVNALIRLHVAAIIIHLVSGGFGVYFIQTGNPHVDVIAPLFEFVTNPEPGDPFFISKPKTLFSVPILTPIVVVEFVTAFFHVIYTLALIFPGVDTFIRAKIINTPSTNPLRWIEYGITATAMASFGNLAIGITDFYVFIRNVTCGITLQGLGYLIEVIGPFHNNTQFPVKKLYRGLYYFQGLLNNLPFVGILLYQTFASTTHGAFNIFLENCFPLAFWYNTFGVICQMSFFEWRQFSDPKYAEKWYIMLSLSTKVAIFWTEFATFKRITEDNGMSTKLGVDWDMIRYMALSLPAGLVFLVGVKDYFAWGSNGSIGLGRKVVTYAFRYL